MEKDFHIFTYPSTSKLNKSGEPLLSRTMLHRKNLGKNRGSRVLTYHYDAAQRITKVSEPGGDILTAFDSYGNRTKITDSLNQDSPAGLPSRRSDCRLRERFWVCAPRRTGLVYEWA